MTARSPQLQAIAGILSALMGIFGGLCFLGSAGTILYMVIFRQLPVDTETNVAFWLRWGVLTVIAVLCILFPLLKKRLGEVLLVDSFWLLLSSYFGMFVLQLALKYGAAGFMGQPLLLVFLLAGCLFMTMSSFLNIWFSR